MSTLREAAQQALETLEALSAAENIIWVQKRSEIEVEHLRAALAQEEQATGKDSFTVDWMKQALTVVWNFPSHPGFHPADSSADQDGEDPTSAWRAGWIAAVGAMQDAVRHMTPDPQEQPEPAQEPVAWATEIIDALQAQYDTEMIQENDSGDALIRLDDAIAAVEDAEKYYTASPKPEPAQEPFGYLWPTGRHPEFRFTQQKRDGVDGMPLYTAPPQRKPLTDEEILEAVGWERAEMYMKLTPNFQVDEAKKETLKNARAVERKVRGE